MMGLWRIPQCVNEPVNESGSLCGQDWNKDFLKSLTDIGRFTEHKYENEDIRRTKNDMKTKVLVLIKRGYVGI
jgi:hypothetical protein